jgi:hypothetical protein
MWKNRVSADSALHRNKAFLVSIFMPILYMVVKAKKSYFHVSIGIGCHYFLGYEYLK